MDPEQILADAGVDLCVQTCGDRADPAILLIAGAAASMLHWPEPLCEGLAGEGRCVVRYDHRDTGRSTSYPPGKPPYSGLELAQDALAILDRLGIERAHLVGMSMGGGLAQMIAIRQPGRVASLTLISSSPAAPTNRDRGLPGIDPEVAAALAALAEPDWADRGAAVEYVFELERLCSAPGGATDDRELRGLAKRTVDRAIRIESLTNHFALASGFGERPGALAGIRTPTLVIHGDQDPILPLDHGRALADEIPGARLLVFEGVGHELPPSTSDRARRAIAEHTA